ncbi:DUF4367 domain-containing protein [Paenibacillus harenae]|uniref:DUF4367 domain-containing protein n=1 Tax=Paenibacillus harenae TaxID=306543 RepID=UPI0003FF8307|nr:DUF4367 domain-containing protein [Paenibacillus harenae]
MNQEKSGLKDKYKTEADDTLFAGMEFDERLKERVRNGIRSEQEQALPLTPKKRVRRSKRWTIGFMTAAAAILVVLASQQMTNTIPEDPPKIVVEVDPGIIQENPGTIFSTPEPQSVAEAEALFGEKLHMPAEVPQSFQLQKEIGAFVGNEGTIDRLEFTYTGSKGTFDYTVDRNAATDMFTDLETVKIGDLDGYIGSMKEDYTVLHWVMEGRLYSIMGDLTREETISVARSASKTIN